HESLRTSFHLMGYIPVQTIHEDIAFKIETLRLDEAGSDIDVLRRAKRIFRRPFDLSKTPLLRVGILETSGTGIDTENPVPKVAGAGKGFMLIDMHHIITDGISQEILITEFSCLLRGEDLPLQKLQYKDYAEWQSCRKQKQILEQQEGFWTNAFSGELPVLNLPTDYPRPVIQNFEGNEISFALNKRETGHLKKAANENEVTLYMVILSAFTILLSKLSGQEDIIVGTPTAGRRHADLENIIGMFVNTLAMR
ncbi:MAG: hypothetical protein GY765_02820, partial [bacterium]|nr:hypothetical protein [bacterium]